MIGDIADLVGSIAWPVVICALVWVFRTELRSLFTVVETFLGRAGRLSVEVGSLKLQLEALSAIQELTAEEYQVEDTAPVRELEQSVQSVSSAPASERIAAIYASVKAQAALLLDGPIEGPALLELSLTSLAEMLLAEKKIRSPTLRAAETLSALNDAASNRTSPEITANEVDRFEELARRTLAALVHESTS